MLPPEVALDRWIKTYLCKMPDFGGYIGKLDLERVDPPSLRALLHLVQEAMNNALRAESVNASGGVEHPPFHFDYIEVKRDAKNANNALAFQHNGFAFIVVTLPLVELLWVISQHLSLFQIVQQLLGLDSEGVRPSALQAALFQMQLSFLISHEYTHHVHQHCRQGDKAVSGVWTEFLRDDISGSLESQAQELDADAYAIYLALAHFLRGGGRVSLLAQLGRRDSTATDGDELLLTCFFLAVMAFFCARWHENINVNSLGQLTHSPAPVRIEYAIRVGQMWCEQNKSVPASWFDAERFRILFQSAAQVIGTSTRQAWDAHISFLRGEIGTNYDQQLLERFEALRKRPHQTTEKAASGTM
jgi:hypothetical protein